MINKPIAWMAVVWVAGLTLAMAPSACAPKSKAARVAVNQFVQHPLLDDVLAGLKEELQASGYEDGKNLQLIVKNASGDQNVTNQINQQFVADKVDVIVPLATPAAQSAVKATKDIPVVFGAITDPVKAGIADSLEKPGGNRTGTTDRWPYDKQVKLMRDILPKAAKVGMVFNPGESNTQASLEEIRPALKKYGFTAVEVPVATTNDVYGAVKSLVGRVDALLIPADNTAVSAFDVIVKVANDKRIPLFAGNVPCVEKGAIATYGVNYKKIGRATGRLVVKILRDKANPGDIPVVVESDSDLIINLSAAKKQGVTIPQELLSAASRTIE
jgi:putative ABC transport system substrate-binding protein